MTWFLAAAAIAGVVLNNYRRRECFLIWMGTNAAWMIYDWSLGATAQAAMFAVYLGLAVWGWFQWGREAKKKAVEQDQAAQEMARALDKMIVSEEECRREQKENVLKFRRGERH